MQLTKLDKAISRLETDLLFKCKHLIKWHFKIPLMIETSNLIWAKRLKSKTKTLGKLIRMQLLDLISTMDMNRFNIIPPQKARITP